MADVENRPTRIRTRLWSRQAHMAKHPCPGLDSAEAGEPVGFESGCRRCRACGFETSGEPGI
eukprot:8740622-Alexandrium_andersonii.AAC.1